MGGVELRDPAGRLEHHGVPLDEAALVPEAAPAMPLAGQRLGGGRGLLQLDVDLVHELLLGRDLTCDQLVCHSGRPSPRRRCADSGK